MIASLLCLFLAVGCGPDAKQSIAPDLLTIADVGAIHADSIEMDTRIINWGAAASGETRLAVHLNDEPVWNRGNVRVVFDSDVPAIDPKSDATFTFEIALDELDADQDYYILMQVNNVPGERNPSNFAFSGFSLDEDGQVVVRCDPDAPDDGQDGGTDPLFAQQWHLGNSGQSAYASNKGVPGEDLGMTGVLSAGSPTGNDVRVAVADTGMELCHPDLAANIEADISHNFNAEVWHEAALGEPFLPTPFGDHGTSVGGVVAAAANNGTGGRGVAPDAILRSYNILSVVLAGRSYADLYADSLGGSETDPDSTGVDIFNMSFGTLAGQFSVNRDHVALFRNGVDNLRGGRGAIYVKSAGNKFYACRSMRRSANDRIGCSSANSSASVHLPYLVYVGGFNDQGRKASYSSAGSNLWISAPAGEFGSTYAAIITADQVGQKRGYDVFSNRGVATDTVNNPHGNFISTFNGTSAAAPNASGAVALLLESNPDLTWRDVKYLLAKTARQIDPDREAVKYLVGGTTYVARLPWVTNAAGYHFHNWYGFGAIALDDALALTASHTPDGLGEFVETDAFTQAEAAAIPDDDGAGVTQVLAVEGLAEDANIEAVTLYIDITHTQPNDLAIHLTSPSGTESILNPIFNDALVADTGLDWHLLSNAYFGESPNGDWTIKVVDAAAVDDGTLNEWSLTFALGTHP